MTKFCKAGIRWMALFAITLALLAGTVPQAAQAAATLCVNPGGTDGCFNTIQAAIDAAFDGDTITIAAGAYTLPTGFAINKPVTIEGTAGVVISPSDAANNDFIVVTAQNVVLKNLILDGNIPQYTVWSLIQKPHYGLTIFANPNGDNLATIENVTVQEFGKSGFNFNNAKGLTLKNLTAADNGGAGMFLTNARRITIEGLTTSNNQWGGVGINIINKDNPTSSVGTSDIVFSGPLTFNETGRKNGAVYLEEETYQSVDPGVITYSFDGSVANVMFPVGTFSTAVGGKDDDYPTRRVRFYTSDAWAQNAVFDTTATGPGHLLAQGRWLKNLISVNYTVVPGLTIQAAIDAAAPGDIINIYPGDYNETAQNRKIYDGTPYTFGLFINKADLTLQGVKADGTPITSANDVAARITTNATNSFGYSGVWVESDAVTIRGLEILDNLPSNNKTIEVVGNNFTLQYSKINASDGGSVYLNDWRYDPTAKKSHLEAYHILNNIFAKGASLDISSGAGYSGDVSGRQIQGNLFQTLEGQDWVQVSFNGYVQGVGWFVHPVGGALISGNTFEAHDQYIRLRGALDTENETEFDFATWFTNNTFPRAAVVLQPDGKVRPYSYTYKSTLFPEVRRIGGTIQGELDHAQVGDTVQVAAGIYNEAPRMLTNGVKLIGAGKETTSIVGPKTVSETILMRADGLLLDGFTITRTGNTTSEWVGNGNSSLVSIFDAINSTIQNCLVTGGRNGIYFNGETTANNTVKNNVITNNRTGVNIARSNTGNLFLNNEISNNWTHGVVITNSPTSSVPGFTFTGNRIFGNWYAQITNRNITNPLTTVINFEKNWLGTTDVIFTTDNAVEPGYDGQIPTQFGGSAVAPGAPYPFVVSDPMLNTSSTDFLPFCLTEACTTFGGNYKVSNQDVANSEKTVFDETLDGDLEIETTYSGTGLPTINLWRYAANPKDGLPLFATPDAFYDIQVLNNTDPEAVLTVVMEATNGKVLRFWDGSRWMVVRNNDGSIAKAANDHLNLTFGPGSTPTLSQLSGTPVVASAPEAVEIQIADTNVQQNLSFTAQVMGKSTSLYGVQVFLTYDATRLNVTNVNLGDGLADDIVAINETGSGTIQFAYSQQAPKLPVSGDEIVLATITFQAKGNAPLGAAAVGFDGTKETIFADANGFALGVYPTTLSGQGDSINVTSRTIVSGQVTRQGRVNFAGTTVDLNGPTDPAAITTGASGTFSFDNLVSGLYNLVASYKGYLTARLEGKDLKASPYSVPAVMLLGGDATHSEGINESDLSKIGGLFLETDLQEADKSAWADINEDGIVNILDLVMAGSNYGKTSTPWSWTPAP